MIMHDLTKTAEELERKAAAANAAGRRALQPKFSRVLETLKAQGHPIPGRLRRLDAALTDEVIEARFDNMPV